MIYLIYLMLFFTGLIFIGFVIIIIKDFPIIINSFKDVWRLSSLSEKIIFVAYICLSINLFAFLIVAITKILN